MALPRIRGTACRAGTWIGHWDRRGAINMTNQTTCKIQSFLNSGLSRLISEAMLLTSEEELRTACEIAVLSWQRQANWKGLQTRDLLHSFLSHGSLPSTVVYAVCTLGKYTYIAIRSYGLPTRLYIIFVFLSLGCLI